MEVDYQIFYELECFFNPTSNAETGEPLQKLFQHVCGKERTIGMDNNDHNNLNNYPIGSGIEWVVCTLKSTQKTVIEDWLESTNCVRLSFVRPRLVDAQYRSSATRCPDQYSTAPFRRTARNKRFSVGAELHELGIGRYGYAIQLGVHQVHHLLVSLFVPVSTPTILIVMFSPFDLHMGDLQC